MCFYGANLILQLRDFSEDPDLDDDIRLSALDALANAENNLEFTQLLEEELKDYFINVS